MNVLVALSYNSMMILPSSVFCMVGTNGNSSRGSSEGTINSMVGTYKILVFCKGILVLAIERGGSYRENLWPVFDNLSGIWLSVGDGAIPLIGFVYVPHLTQSPTLSH